MVQINRMILIALVLLTAQVRADGHTGITLTLDNFHRAAATADMDSYFAAMSDDVVFLGTDGSERWQGQDFRIFVQSHFAAGRGWTYVPVQRNVMLAADGQTAWFDETLQNDGLGICRVLGYQAQEDFKRGTLVPVLAEYNAPALPVQFVFPHSRLLSPRVRQFLDAVVGPLQERLSGTY